MSVLLYERTILNLTKLFPKKLYGNYTRMQWAVLNKSRKQYPNKQLLYGHLPLVLQTIQERRTRHAGLYWSNSSANFSCEPPHMNAPVLADRQRYIHQLCTDTECWRDYQLRGIDDEDRQRVRVKRILACGKS